MSSQSPRVTSEQFRQAAGRFATGITIATALDPSGSPHGLTVNSFTSVSLEPPLVLFCLAHAAASRECFLTTKHFAINILAADQRPLSERFARKGHNRFEGVEWWKGVTGAPILGHVLAAMECNVYQMITLGDHDVLAGQVVRLEVHEKKPLLYYASRYHQF
ncbi:MAG TPA: flavin reductase family protein [Candidatus Acidoferrales bacterium]|nr:flavin reductase family protein [Candidatus Acidoferrales bacterium]